MMQDFGHIGLTEAQIDLLNVAENFCREKSPIEKVRALMEDELGYDPKVWEEIGKLGWTAIAIPEALDGVGLGLSEVVPVMEQMGRYMMATPFASTTMAAQALLKAGTQAQKKAILPRLAAGAAACLALSEMNGDWDLNNITAKASLKRASGGDVYNLSGTKIFVQNGISAQWIIASVLIEGEAGLVIIEKDKIPADAFRREKIIDETKRSYELTLDGISLTQDDILEAGETRAAFAHIHLVANLLNAAELTGGAQSTVDYTVEYLNTRKQFGKLIGAYQAMKHPTVQAYIGYEKSRSLLYAAAMSFNEQGAGEIATRMAAVQSETALSFAADRSIQFHGGFGFTYDCDAQLYRRRAIFNASQYGDGAYHKSKLADLLL